MFTYIGKQFAHPSGLGGKMATKLMNVMNTRLYQLVLTHILHTEAKYILDIGFGNGKVLKKASRLHAGSYYGVEVSKSMLQKASKDKAMKGMQLKYGKIEDLPFPAKFFDYQYSINTLYFWESLEQGFHEMHRCAKPGGYCSVAFYSPTWLKRLQKLFTAFALYDKAQVIQEMQKQVFIIEKIQTLGKEKGYCIIAYRK